MAALFLAMIGLVDPRALPKTPLFFGSLAPVVRFLEKRFHAGVIIMNLLIGVLVRRLRGDWGSDGSHQSWPARHACRRCVELLDRFQNRDGSWMFADSQMASLILPAL